MGGNNIQFNRIKAQLRTKTASSSEHSSTGGSSSPVAVANESPRQLDVVGGLRLELPHQGAALPDHVEQHLRQLGVLVQVHQVGQAVVHLEGQAGPLTPTQEGKS